MNPCEVGFTCPYCVPSDDEVDVNLCCTYPVLMVPNHWGVERELDLVGECECPLVEKSSELYDWLQVMDDPTVQLAIEKANKVKDEEAQKLCDKMLQRRKRIEEQEKTVDRDDPF